MGVFDFIKNAGAKVGIGTSTDEDAAVEAAEASARAERDAKAAKMRRDAIKANQAAEQAMRDKVKGDRQARLAERRDANVKARKKAAAKERMAEYAKSAELEKYVTSVLGAGTENIDIRFDNGTAYITGEVADEQTRERVILTVGNAQGVGKVDEEIDVVEPADPSHFHTVASGDTLWGIAEKVYGDGSRYPEIFEANKPMLADPDKIYPGQVLRCPMGDE